MRIAMYFDEPYYWWCKQLKKSKVQDGFVELYFEDVKKASVDKKTKVKFLMAKLLKK